MDTHEWRNTAKRITKKYLRITGRRRLYDLCFWLTHRCVYKCDFCVIEKNSGPFLPKEQVFALIQEAIPYKLGMVQITGGDPMLHPDFAEICNSVADSFPDVFIHVTGRFIDENSLEKLKMDKKQWHWWLTIVSHHREINDRYRAKGALDDTLRASRLLKERNQNARIHINVLPETLDHLKETIQFVFEELKPFKVTTEPVSPIGRALRTQIALS